MRPLAERMRPRDIDEMVGQKRLLGQGSALRRAIEGGHVHSMILWGPPGCGKTTLALLLAQYAEAEFIAISAVMSGLPEVRKALGLEQQWRSIPDAAPEVQATINAGVPLAESCRNSAVVRELGSWADALSPQAREDSNGFLNRLFRRA